MVRKKTPARHRNHLLSPRKSEASKSESTTSESKDESSSREENLSHVLRSRSSRKSTPRKSASKSGKSRTTLFVQKTKAVNKSGNKRVYKVKLLRDIKFLQKTVHHLIPKLPFSRLVREILLSYRISDVTHVTATALEAIQEAAELYLTCLFADCNLVAMHAKRVTIKPIDIALVLNLRENR